MKKITVLIPALLLFAAAVGVSAQPTAKKSVPVYAYGSVGLIVPLGGRLAGEAMVGPGWSFSVFYLNENRDSPNTPSDFTANAIIFGGVSHIINENLTAWGATVGRAWRLSNENRLRFHLRAGVAFGRFESPENFVRNPNGFFSNYNYKEVRYKTVNFILQPMLDIPFCRFFGLSVGFFINHGKYWKSGGLELTHNLGYFSGRRPPRKTIKKP